MARLLMTSQDVLFRSSSDGSHVAIGAYLNDGGGSGSGHVRISMSMLVSWTQVGADIDGEAANDYSGRSVSFDSDGSHVAIGAPYNDGNGSDSGHVRVYDIETPDNKQCFLGC